MKNPTYARFFPEIYSISDFIDRNHPVNLHPSHPDYSQYWDNYDKKAIEGLWGRDYNETLRLGGWRYMTPQMYHFVNGTKIKLVDEANKKRTIFDFPRLLDTTWIMGYGWITALGFSGFKNDPEISCFRPLQKIEQIQGGNTDIELTEDDKVLIEMAMPNIVKKDGSFKKYVPALEYLYKTHKEPMGAPLYDNEAEDFMLFCTRGFGKSYFMAACIDHDWRYHGTRIWSPDWLEKVVAQTIFIGSAVESKVISLLKKWEDTNTFHKTGMGSYKDRYINIPGALYQEHQGNLEPNSKNPFTHRFDLKEIKSESSTWNEYGTGTHILAQTYIVNRLTAAVSHRCRTMYHDEIGLSPYLEIIWGANENVKRRDFRDGSEFMAGTGGEIAKAIGCKKLFTAPRGYHIVAYPDLTENSGKEVACFIPAYMATTKYKDHLGNTKYEVAFSATMQTREHILKNGGIQAYTEHIQNNPITWTEMFLESNSTYMPVEYARQTLSTLMSTGEHLIYGKPGHFEYTDATKKQVAWKRDVNRIYNPIRTNDLYTLQGRLEGDIVIYEHPFDDLPSPVYRNSLYKITYDPLKDDGTGPSLGAIIVWKGLPSVLRPNERSWTIVATYYGRRDNVDQIHEIAYQLGLYYNAKILFEVNVGSVATWFRLMNAFHMLQPCPLAAMKSLLVNPTSKYKVGIHMSKELIINSEPLVRKLCTTPLAVDSNGNQVVIIHNFLCTFMLEQIIAYNRKDNFDGIRCLMMLVVWLEEEVLEPREYNPSEIKEHYMERLKRKREENEQYSHNAYNRIVG